MLKHILVRGWLPEGKSFWGKTVILSLLLGLFWIQPLFAEFADTAWVSRYNGPASGNDQANALIVDSSGNIYVTGASDGGGFTTIKHDSDGNQLWVRICNGPGIFGGSGAAIAVDMPGNVYVTGSVFTPYGGEDYATVKYDSDGNQLWVRTYGGNRGDDDEAKVIAIDGDGNVYVSGTSIDTLPIPEGSLYWCAPLTTIKYDSNGNQLWVKKWVEGISAFPVGIGLDSFGNIFIGGGSILSDIPHRERYVMIKYDPSGNQTWEQTYESWEGSPAYAGAMAVDGSGNSYLSGFALAPGVQEFGWVTIRYYPNGDTAWLRQVAGADIARLIPDPSGNIYVAGNTISYNDTIRYLLIKYDANGNLLWQRSAFGAFSDKATAMALDDSDNVYVTGWAGRTYGGSIDYGTLKYDSDGNEIWAKRYIGVGKGGWATSIVTDHSGNVYVTGKSEGNGTGFDWATLKYVTITFRHGDPNGDGNLNVSDVIYTINYLFKGGAAPYPFLAGDANCDGNVNVSDVIYLINYLFKGGPPPC
jgi:hypothetical protein